MKILGISCFYHDSAVCALEDGQIKFAIQEERLSRIKHDARFPILALTKALEHCQWRIDDIDEIVFYEQPQIKLNRIFDQVLDGWPFSWKMFSCQFPQYIKSKYQFEKIVHGILRNKVKVRFCQHHNAHAAAAFFTSKFENSLVVTIDGVGEYETVSIYEGIGNKLLKRQSIIFPDSLGLFYSAFTDYLGFEVNEGEYKIMGLAAYGKPVYCEWMLNNILFLEKDGSFHLNQKYFDFSNHNKHYKDKLSLGLKIFSRKKTGFLEEKHYNLAASVQKVLELALLNIFSKILKKFPYKNVCYGGGVALNCTANSALLRALDINLHIHPSSGDAGAALGAALFAFIEKNRKSSFIRFNFQPYLGIDLAPTSIEPTLKINNVYYEKIKDLAFFIAQKLKIGRIVGLIQGNDEWGPRALGNRSILADPRQSGMKDYLNAKIKFRESFRPFGSVIMQEYFSEYFEDLKMIESPYMLYTHKVKKPEKIPACVHIDNTSRVQTVTEKQNFLLYNILKEFKKLTGVPVLINTSFNLKGEPIVSSVSDGLNTFYSSGIDDLVIGDYWVEKV